MHTSVSQGIFKTGMGVGMVTSTIPGGKVNQEETLMRVDRCRISQPDALLP